MSEIFSPDTNVLKYKLGFVKESGLQQEDLDFLQGIIK